MQGLQDYLYVLSAPTYAEATSGKPRIVQDFESMQQCGTIPEAEPIKACVVPGYIHGAWVPCFIDSGATISVISSNLADKLEREGKLQREASNVRAALFGNRGDAVQFREAATIQVLVSTACVNVKVQIMPDLPFECLLGDDFLTATGAVLDYGNRMFVTAGTAVPFQKRGEMIRMVTGLYSLQQHVPTPWSFNC
jgi:hypothetical protein